VCGIVQEEEINNLYKNGIEAFKKGELTHAGDLFMQVIDEKEDHHRAWNALGVVLTKTKKYDKADVCFENALSLDPSNEVYEKNRKKNKKHVPSGIRGLLSADNLFLPLPVKPVFLLIGFAVLIFLVITIFLIIPFLFPAPISDTAGEIPVHVEQADELVLLTNVGGPGLEKVSQFKITGNNQTIFAPDRSERILGTDRGAMLAIPVDELHAVVLDDEITIRVYAIFPDDTSRLVVTERLVLPAPTPEPVPATPVPVQYTPVFKKGDIVLDNETGKYRLISDLLPDHQYLTYSLSRRNDGLFTLLNAGENESMMEYDKKVISSGLHLPYEEYPYGMSLQAYLVSKSPESVAYPLYNPGDIVSRMPGEAIEALIILGYDKGTDEYATDTIMRYPTGEWGFRPGAIAAWVSRSDIERMYSSRINRIALSRIGIGADSSPPGTHPAYREGDIIAKDRGADSQELLILSYDQNTSSYNTDVIYHTYGGSWERSGENTSVLRSVLERQYPYKVRTVDISLVTVNDQLG